MNDVKIQEYDERYEQQCIDLILGIQTGEFGIPITLKDQPDLEDVRNFYQQGNGNFWVALDGEEVVGTVALIDISNSQVALRKMFVANSFRGKERGVARALLDKSVEWCRQKAVHDIFLGTTSAYLAAHRFYEKNDFALVDRSQLPPQFPVMKVDSRFYRRAL